MYEVSSLNKKNVGKDRKKEKGCNEHDETNKCEENVKS